MGKKRPRFNTAFNMDFVFTCELYLIIHMTSIMPRSIIVDFWNLRDSESLHDYRNILLTDMRTHKGHRLPFVGKLNSPAGIIIKRLYASFRLYRLPQEFVVIVVSCFGKTDHRSLFIWYSEYSAFYHPEYSSFSGNHFLTSHFFLSKSI